jgi:uncharacterized protein YdeI (YjbR/CyaY-like superfamily)
MKPIFFPTPAKWRRWLERHHDTKDELWVGLYKKGSGKASITWPQSVDAALCFGWIDGIRKSLDETSYMIRFTPRRLTSIWSAVNIKRFKELEEQGLVGPIGRRAFERRETSKSRVYSYEQRQHAKLPPEYLKQLKQNPTAWKFYQGQAPWYRRTAAYWVISAKQEKTRQRRLATLIDDSSHGRTIKPLTRK